MTLHANVTAALGALAIGLTAALVSGPAASAEPVIPALPDPVTPARINDSTVDTAAGPAPAQMPTSPVLAFATATDAASGSSPAGQNPAPYSGAPVFAPPTFNPLNGSLVGVAKPIIVNFQRPIADRSLAEQAIQYRSRDVAARQLKWAAVGDRPAPSKRGRSGAARSAPRDAEAFQQLAARCDRGEARRRSAHRRRK